MSWLPLYHDMGLVLGVCAPILSGYRAELSSPVAFLERPARWVRALAENPHAFSAAPNFAFDLAARKTTDGDLAGLDLGGVLGIINGAERVEPATLERFADRFCALQLSGQYAASFVWLGGGNGLRGIRHLEQSAPAVHFDVDELSAGRAERCAAGSGTALVRYKVPQSPTLRIVDYDTHRECPPDVVGEMWVHGENVADGYWHRPPEEQRCFGATLVDPSPGTPDGPWLRTGDLGFISEGELFIVGRIKDLLIIRGRNYYPEDIEATVQEITRGRVAAIAVPLDSTEQLVTVVELTRSEAIPARTRALAQRGQKRRHLGDLQCARRQCRRPRSGVAGIDSHHDERQDPTRRLRRAVPPRPIRPVGRLAGRRSPPRTTHAGHCPDNGPCRQCRTVPDRYDRAHAEQAQTGAATARVLVWRFRDGNDGWSGCPVRVSTNTAGVSSFSRCPGFRS